MKTKSQARAWLLDAVDDALLKRKRVAVFAEKLADSKRLFDQVIDYEQELDGDWLSKVSRVNGQQRIEFQGGGLIRFYSLKQIPFGSMRGALLDIVYRPEIDSSRLMEFNAEVLPAMATSPDGRIVVYRS